MLLAASSPTGCGTTPEGDIVRRQIAAVLSAGAVACGLLVAPATAGATTGSGSTIEWGPCEEPRLQQAGAECGFVPVPLDYAKPDGRQIKLRVSRVSHTVPDAEYQGVMLVNPGGPGGSGLTLPLIGGQVPKEAGAAYDWIGFDPRGVGRSEPRLNCLRYYEGYDRPQYVPEDAGIMRNWQARSEAYANACQADEAALLPHMKTTDSARDMDEIRKALGRDKINYFGFSYGTYLAQVYSTMFPDHVRRMVLDSNVNPARVWYEANLDQDVAFERNVQIWFDWLAEYNEVFGLGDSGAEVEEKFYQIRDRLNGEAAGGLIGGAEWTDLFLPVGYNQFNWEPLGHLFANYVRTGDWQPLKDAYTPAEWDDNGYAVYLAVECSDTQWPQEWSKWRRDNWQTHAKAPFETWGNAWYNAPCYYWQAEPGKPVDVDGSQVDNALLISGTLDGATPYEGSLEVRKRYPNSRLIALVGETTHAASLYGNACVDDRIADYLLTGKLPERIPGAKTADVLCPQLPDPVPSAQQPDEQQKAQLAALRQASRPALAGRVAGE